MWPTFPCARPPLSPCLLLLCLPRVVNSLKLLIKNILLSPPKVCFPVIFLLEGEMGEGGRGQAVEARPSWVSMGDPGEPRPGAEEATGRPLPCVTLPGFPALPREAFLRAPTLGATARLEEWHQLPRALCALLPHPTESLKTTTAHAQLQ